MSATPPTRLSLCVNSPCVGSAQHETQSRESNALVIRRKRPLAALPKFRSGRVKWATHRFALNLATPRQPPPLQLFYGKGACGTRCVLFRSGSVAFHGKCARDAFPVAVCLVVRCYSSPFTLSRPHQCCSFRFIFNTHFHALEQAEMNR